MCKYRFGKLDSDLGPDDIIGPKYVIGPKQRVLCGPSQSCVLEIESG